MSFWDQVKFATGFGGPDGTGNVWKGLDPTTVKKADATASTAAANQLGGTSQDFLSALSQYQNRAAPVIDLSKYSNIPQLDAAQFQNAPQLDASLFKSAAEGNAPSAAQIQLQQGQEQNLKNQMAMLASGRGGYDPGAARVAFQQGAEAGNVTNQQQALLRAQEMAQARQQYLAGLTSNLSAANSGQDRYAGLLGKNLDASIQGRGQMIDLDKTNAQNFLQGRSLDDNAQNNLRSIVANLQTNQASSLQGLQRIEQERDNQSSAAKGAVIGGVLSAGGALGAAGISGGKKAFGGIIPGKAKVVGDSFQNDVVPTKLSPGELVVPRSVVAMGPQAVAAFAQKAPEVPIKGNHAKGGMMAAMNQEPVHFGQVLQSMAELQKRMAALEAKKGKK